jgi:hypothetical protein
MSVDHDQPSLLGEEAIVRQGNQIQNYQDCGKIDPKTTDPPNYVSSSLIRTVRKPSRGYLTS